MVAPRAAPPAGAFLSGQAVFYGRELLAELPLVSDLPSSHPRLALGGAVRMGPATPLGLNPGSLSRARRSLQGGGCGRKRDASFSGNSPLPALWPGLEGWGKGV